MEGDTSKIASMLAVGVNVNARDARDGDTALLRASSALQVAAIKVLLQHGALVNLCDMEGVSPLASTVDKTLKAEGGKPDVEKRRLASIRILLENGAEVNASDSEGNTTIHCAAERGYVGVLKMLLDAGANLVLRNNKGETAGEIAYKHGHTTCVLMLAPPPAIGHGFSPLFAQQQHKPILAPQPQQQRPSFAGRPVRPKLQTPLIPLYQPQPPAAYHPEPEMQQQRLVKCTECGDAAARHRCNECEESYCDACERAHRQSRFTFDHPVVPLEATYVVPGPVAAAAPRPAPAPAAPAASFQQTSYRYCATHTFATLGGVCDVCLMAVCDLCAASADHAGHRILGLDEGAIEVANNLQAYREELYLRDLSLATQRSAFDGEMQRLNARSMNTALSIASEFTRLVDDMNQTASSLNNRRQTLVQEAQDVVAVEIASHTTARDKAKALHDQIASATTTGFDEILRQLEKGGGDKLANLSKAAALVKSLSELQAKADAVLSSSPSSALPKVVLDLNVPSSLLSADIESLGSVMCK